MDDNLKPCPKCKKDVEFRCDRSLHCEECQITYSFSDEILDELYYNAVINYWNSLGMGD